MFTRVKTNQETKAIRTSGKILADILKNTHSMVVPGMNGKDVSAFVVRELKGQGVKPSFLGYNGFPDVICISVNDAVVHGIPNAEAFKEGDIISFDCGVTFDGMVTDSAFSMIVGQTENKDTIRLLDTTERSMYAGIETLRDGVRVGDISSAVQLVLDAGKLGIVRELVGHGVGHNLHEEPDIPNYGHKNTGPKLKAGMTIAIEPMATLGDYHVKLDDDGWTFRTVDGGLAAHFEHTILITRDGYEILTARD
ncbi:MAG TPA: type I methionyl aminopeptidase [Patescibacteria group bacterium]|jgi:methionyl aminopeptidase|nr:type I methionyl aminopeptidase [Patescibacteria group bacterium]